MDEVARPSAPSMTVGSRPGLPRLRQDDIVHKLNPKEFVVIKNIIVGILGLVFVLGLLGFLLFGAKLVDVFLPMLISAVGIVAIELYSNRDDTE